MSGLCWSATVQRWWLSDYQQCDDTNIAKASQHPPTPPPNIPSNIRLQHILSTRLTGAPNQRGIDVYQLCCIFPTPLGLWWDQMLLLKWLFTWYELYYVLKLVAEDITWLSLLYIYRVLCIVALPKIRPHLYKGTDSVLSKYILG